MNARSTRELALLSLRGASALILSKDVSPVELTQACLARIEALNPSLNAFITQSADSALTQARTAEAEVLRGIWRGPLHGIPVALKDMIDVAGVRSTGASALFEERIAEADAAVVERLRAAGAVFLGKLNMQEFAYGGTSVPSYYGAVLNPWNPTCIAGGSSGGSAAAVAAGLCYAALGTDTGGSVREPAAFCGVVGLKATYGRVSNRGIIPLAPSLDHVGPLTRTVEDCAIVLEAIAGYDASDVTSAERPPLEESGDELPADTAEPTRGLRDLRGLRIGIPREFYYADLHPEVEAAVNEALDVLTALGAETRDVALEVSADRTVFRAEAFAYHAEHIARTPELYLPETLAKLRMGTSIEARTYIRARRELEEIRRGMVELFSRIDALVTPTAPVPAPLLAEYPKSFAEVLALEGGSLLKNTRPFNMYGV
ncbi:MAG TPA: amidase, partial [Steroidobacteraceae bacterium]|nr:amidase [Steroidobacteraceae bacterium]